MIKRALVFGVVVALALCMGSLAFAGEKPDGTVEFKTHNIAVGVGVTWGDGTLTFQGKEYKFSIKGLTLVDLGVGDVEATGEVYNLKKAADLGGDYSLAKAGIAVGVGVNVQQMVNDNGVKINVKAKQQGIQFSLAGGGLKITMK